MHLSAMRNDDYTIVLQHYQNHLNNYYSLFLIVFVFNLHKYSYQQINI